MSEIEGIPAVIERKAKSTLTPIEMNCGDQLKFTLCNGKTVTIQLLKTWFEIIKTDLNSFDLPKQAAKTVYRFFCELDINNKKYCLEREIPTQKSFYEPWVIEGTRIWFDAISGIFKEHGGFLLEKSEYTVEDGTLVKSKHFTGIKCQPAKDARFAIQDAALKICPEKLHPWCPLPEGGLKIGDCYRGEDCWMGPYDGMLAHEGLDINHPDGTPLWAPFDIDDQYYFNSLEMGHNNNRWRGIRKWENGSTWIIQAHHITELTVPEHVPLRKGQQYAKGAGVYVGAANHSHFVFRIDEEGASYFLDPWILFWQMYRDKCVRR